MDTLPELWCRVAAPCTWTLRTPVENLVDTGEEPVFAFYLDNHVDGELAFGGVNSAHCTVYPRVHELGEHQLLASQLGAA